MLPVSVCIIAKDEELHIGECLRRLSAFDLEIIVVDTGSADRTGEIAASYTPFVYHFDWIQDFSAARNFAVSKASNDWILSVDCDEYVQAPEDGNRLFETWFEENCHFPAGLLGRYSLKNVLLEQDGAESSLEYVTRFFHRRFYQYEGCVREQLAALTSSPRVTLDMPLSFLHMGL